MNIIRRFYYVSFINIVFVWAIVGVVVVIPILGYHFYKLLDGGHEDRREKLPNYLTYSFSGKHFNEMLRTPEAQRREIGQSDTDSGSATPTELGVITSEEKDSVNVLCGILSI